MNQKIKAIITGSTGMVGEGVLLECLKHPDVESLLVINRRPCGITHPKLHEVIHIDFFNLLPVESELSGYNACFFCAGVSSVRMKESEYKRITYDLTINFAQTLSRLNPDMTFCYVSGAGTDSSEKGRMMWARIKGKTENDLMKLPFKSVYAFRPAFMKAVKGQKNLPKFYKYIQLPYPVLHALFPLYFGTLSDVGLAMINSSVFDFEKKVLEAKDIAELAEKTS
ncbi:MAG: epimerase [Bacteroidetes bacterium RBG_13_42_15]|nr:MAG: epimerase [Bacteroidetes bacterium RBG_13_42_15]